MKFFTGIKKIYFFFLSVSTISDKDKFLQSLSGTNDLDITIRQDKTKQIGLARRSRENSPNRIQRLVTGI